MVVHGDQIYVDFVRFLIREDLHAWCLRYNICSTWFLDIRISTCLYIASSDQSLLLCQFKIFVSNTSTNSIVLEVFR